MNPRIIHRLLYLAERKPVILLLASTRIPRRRTTMTCKIEIGRHVANVRVLLLSQSPLYGRLLVYSYCKYDPIRFSEHNIDEKHNRGRSSSYLSTISRLKQHPNSIVAAVFMSSSLK